MRELILSKGHISYVDDEDYEWLSGWKWSVTTSGKILYAQRSIYSNNTQRSILLHRFLLGVSGRGIMVDHVDHNGLNNQRSNLRVCNSSQNQSNMKSHEDSTSKYVGVSWVKSRKRWNAAIGVNYKVIQLGRYKTEQEAALAYNSAAIKYKGEYANLNVL